MTHVYCLALSLTKCHSVWKIVVRREGMSWYIFFKDMKSAFELWINFINGARACASIWECHDAAGSQNIVLGSGFSPSIVFSGGLTSGHCLTLEALVFQDLKKLCGHLPLQTLLFPDRWQIKQLDTVAWLSILSNYNACSVCLECSLKEKFEWVRLTLIRRA